MKFSSLSRMLLGAMLVMMPVMVVAAETLNPNDLMSQMQSLLRQYSERVRILEAENILLRNTMAKHEIQIPLEEYAKIMSSTGATTPLPAVPGQSNVTTTPTSPTTPSIPQMNTSSLPPLQKGFIDQIRQDWEGIRGAYKMPADARLGAYEFVKNAAGNNAFADVIYGDGTPEGAYNAKLLYEFDKTTFKRKLIGFFEYSTESKAYVTKIGQNPFAGVERDIVRENAYVTTSTGVATTQPSTPSTPVINTNASQAATEIEAKILAAYEKRDLATLIRISDEYLKGNPPTYKILLYRYRMYFLTREFNKALEEIKKMETAKLATPLVYCDAYAVALYAKNQTLANSYKKLAGNGCKITP